jgi:hypothetical protein
VLRHVDWDWLTLTESAMLSILVPISKNMTTTTCPDSPYVLHSTSFSHNMVKSKASGKAPAMNRGDSFELPRMTPVQRLPLPSEPDRCFRILVDCRGKPSSLPEITLTLAEQIDALVRCVAISDGLRLNNGRSPLTRSGSHPRKQVKRQASWTCRERSVI